MLNWIRRLFAKSAPVLPEVPKKKRATLIRFQRAAAMATVYHDRRSK